MKIYIASSWKISEVAKDFATLFRIWGHEVYCYAESDKGQIHFNWNDYVHKLDNGITCLDIQISKQAFDIDKAGMDWAECCVLINPSGKDAHLEAGYMKGCCKKLYIIGMFPALEFSNMYHLADGLVKVDGSGLDYLRELLENDK